MRRAHLVFIFLTAIGVCCKSDEPNVGDLQNQMTSKLSTTWKVSDVMRDGVDITTDYSGFTLTLGAGTYSTLNGGLSWPKNGTWSYDGDSLEKITRDGNLPISIALSTDINKLTLVFRINESTYQQGGRTKSLQGNYTFELTR
jgi:hypothetical protein